MGLQIKSMHEVFTNLVDWITARTDKITDFNVGSAARTLSEAIAIQFEEFYFSMKQNVLYAIENSIYDAFSFDRRLSTNSSGYVTIEFETQLPNEMIFPVGTMFCTSSLYNYLYFESTEEVYAPEGAISIMVPVKCKTSGVVGNIPANAISTIVTSNSVIKKVYNSTSFNNATDEETAYERKKRFQNYVKTLARGTRDAIVYGCLEVEGVAGAWVDDSYIGYAKLYAHNSNGELPDDLKSKIIRNMDNYRAAGIEIEVLSIVKKNIDLSLKIMIGNDYDTDTYNELIYDLLIGQLEQYAVSDDFYVSNVIHTVKAAYDDVVINVVIESGEDTVIANNELVRPGDIKVNCIKMKDWRS